MKLRSSLSQTRITASRSTGGVALILVLAFLVLMSALVLAMFTASRTEMASADSYASGVTVRQLSDMAVGVVESQINDGTKSWVDPATQNKRLTWSSQPGLIRTYADDGSADRSFKLYSSGNMVASPGDYVPQTQLSSEVPNDWPVRRGSFVDLNEPVVVPDPAGKIQRSSDPKKYSASYPIIDPGAVGKIEGLKLNLPGAPSSSGLPTVPGFGGSNPLSAGYDPGISADANTTANPAPMPVQWMYVLANGKLTTPQWNGKLVKWSDTDPNRPTEANPIVGRVAFWADDETCKLNINTASEGIYWDRAWSNASTTTTSPYGELELNYRPPIVGEFERYPGHPATVCLSPVFSGLIPTMKVPTGNNLSTTEHNKILSLYYNLAPRVGAGGALGGTIDTVARSGSTSASPATMVLDQNRLYSSVDELIFAAPEGPNGTSPGTTPSATTPRTMPLDSSNSALIGRSDLEKAKFFITAYNRAPDVNVFGRPRISLWPLQQFQDPNAGAQSDNTGNRAAVCPATARNTTDELLAFCSTVAGKYPFYFQRYSIYLGTLRNARSTQQMPFGQLPKYGYEMPSSQSPTLDWEGAKWFDYKKKITGQRRNQELYKYLQDLTSNKIPGWGGAFTDKYQNQDRDQILTEMVDLIRFGSNCYALDTKPLPGPHGETDVRYEYAPAKRMPTYAAPGEAQVVPLVPPDGTPGAGTKGIGRFPTITEAAFIFHVSKASGATPTDMRALLALQPYSPASGVWNWSPLVRYVIRDLDQITINGRQAFPAGALMNYVTSRTGSTSKGGLGQGFSYTAFPGFCSAFLKSTNAGTDDFKTFAASGQQQAGDPETQYNFISNDIPLDPSGQFTFSGGTVTIEIHTGFEDPTIPPSAATLVQTIQIKFPPGKWNQPKLAFGSATYTDFSNRLPVPPGNGFGASKFIDSTNDVVRSVQVDPVGPARGDLRAIATLKVVPPSYFAPASNYGSQPDKVVYSLRHRFSPVPGIFPLSNLNATLWSGANTANNYIVAASGMTSATMFGPGGALPGDFDNGTEAQPDGAYINKPDDYYQARNGNSSVSDAVATTYDAKLVPPNRQVYSPTMFGSLPAGRVSPWRTLLFCANPAAGRNHPGFIAPRDHLFLDLFTMPVVAPYAISEPFSTAGRVNINFELAPFTYIRRDTAFRGVLKSTRITAYPTAGGHKIPDPGNFGTPVNTIFRKEIDAEKTTDEFYKRFGQTSKKPFTGDTGAFRTASEICDMSLIPAGQTAGSLNSFWQSNAYTGDNAREATYGQIYSRITTKSNVFTVHIRAQTLRKAKPAPGLKAGDRASAFAEWDETKDQVLGEYRGSSTIERYIDPSDPTLPDFATDRKASMDDYYRFRVVGTKRFNP